MSIFPSSACLSCFRLPALWRALAAALLLCLAPGSAWAENAHDLMMGLYFKRDFAKAVPAARELANQGDEVALYLLGHMLTRQPQFGSDSEAARVLALAADRGNLGAMEDLAQAWAFNPANGQPQRSPNSGAALALFKKLRDAGSPRAYSYLGKLTAAGFDGPADVSRAVTLLKEGIDKGDAASAFELAYLNEHGSLGAPDFREAERLYRQAAADGLPEARHMLALMLDRTAPQSRGSTEAVKIMQEADQSGLAIAAVQLGIWYIQGHGVDRDNAKALALFEKAAAQGNKEAHYILGDVLQLGKIGPKNPTEALKHFQFAADHGFANAWFRIGVLQESGELGRRDPVAALANYRKCAAMGDPECQALLAKRNDTGGNAGPSQLPNASTVFDGRRSMPR